MEAPQASYLDQQFEAADQAMRALAAATTMGDEVHVAALLEQLASRASGLRMALLAQAANAESADLRVLTVADQVHATNRVTRQTARADVRLARDLADRFPILGEAWRAGLISEPQARAIVGGLRVLPAGLSVRQLEQCQHDLIGYAGRFDPHELRVLAERMIEVIDPEFADALEADRLSRQERLAFGRRYLTLTPDRHGSMLIRGQLPITDGELLAAQLDALTPSAASYQFDDEPPTRPARRADALVRLTKLAAATGDLPAHGGDRPQLLVTVTLDQLRTGLGKATLLGSGCRLSAGEARRLACDAQLIPSVLGSDSEPLDVGRAQRLFGRQLRQALIMRDQGCAFPGCDAPPASCDGHHIVPWHQGGATSLDNGVLLCPYHHRMVEPDPTMRTHHQWQITMDEVGNPWFTPPRPADPARRPRQHHRYQLRDPGPTMSKQAPSPAA